MSAFSDVFSSGVVDPWQKSCQQAEYPWTATPALRQEWLAGMRSQDPVVALSMAIGLARCALPSFEEFEAVNTYFSDPPSEIISDEVILELLLTGATPPVVLLQNVFTPNLTQDYPPFPSFWSFYGCYLRHPFQARLAQILLGCSPNMLIAIATYNLLANPASPFPSSLPEEVSGLWISALRAFHPQGPRPDPRSLSSELERFAFFLRCDFSQRDFIALCKEFPLPDPYFFAQLDHPCLFVGEVPQYNPQNPSQAALKYFATESDVCALYRFYNPLLNYPWLAEDITQTRERGVYLSLLLAGHAPVQIEKHKIMDLSHLVPVVQSHPAWQIVLVERAFKQANPELASKR